MKYKGPVVLGFAVLHYMMAAALVFASLGAAYDHFDHDTPYTRSEQVISRAANVLMWPGYSLSMRIGLGRLQPLHSLLAIFNSLLWGVGGYVALWLMLNMLQRLRKPAL